MTMRIGEGYAAVREEFDRAVIGLDSTLEMLFATLLAGGHALLEGYPGTAKTLAVRALAASVGGRYARIQFTPDLMPADITGTSVFNPADRTFTFRPGPVFADIVLADEINRAPSKTQAALLEAMQERRVTADGRPHELPRSFTVFATQNPIEYEGTYPLPEAQLDRFMVKIAIGYPEAPHEREMLARYRDGVLIHELPSGALKPRLSIEDLLALRGEVHAVRAEDAIVAYCVDVVRQTRDWPAIAVGASPRAAVNLLLLSKALAAVRGRDYVVPDDVKGCALPVLRHRVMLRAETEVEGTREDDVVRDVIGAVKVPK
ncbi:MAG: MoxR family ATPase [Planctomycetes bacterium]|nr:MoxR family ATPase [Planctomycetota bacterium]